MEILTVHPHHHVIYINISPYSVEKHVDEPISPDMEVSPASDLISAAETSTQVILSNTPVGLYS